MHFKKKGGKITAYPFKCGSDSIDVVSKYKYLGLWFTDNLDLQYMAEQVATSAQRALGLVIAKCKSIGGLPYDCYTRLYESLVQSILDYGAPVWAHKEYPCIKAVQHRAIRFFLGVSKRTANNAILGDIGWTPQLVNQRLAMCRQICRYGRMDNSRLNLHIIQWASRSNVDNWISRVRKEYVDLNIDHLLEFDIPQSKNNIKAIKSVYMSSYKESWSESLNKVDGIAGIGNNKLRTYRLFKDEYCTENYVQNIQIKYGYRKAIAMMRCGSAPLAIETGRFKQGKYIPPEERLCTICLSGVEDEFHVMFNCDFYSDI